MAIPPGGEEAARRFYGDVVGLEEIPKPGDLAARGGCWFRAGDQELHLGIERAFNAARKAHPAFLVDDLARLRSSLNAAGAEILEDQPLPGFHRFHTSDPFGNRLEFVQPRD